jgi:hypothetical protein
MKSLVLVLLMGLSAVAYSAEARLGVFGTHVIDKNICCSEENLGGLMGEALFGNTVKVGAEVQLPFGQGVGAFAKIQIKMGSFGTEAGAGIVNSDGTNDMVIQGIHTTGTAQHQSKAYFVGIVVDHYFARVSKVYKQYEGQAQTGPHTVTSQTDKGNETWLTVGYKF